MVAEVVEKKIGAWIRTLAFASLSLLTICNSIISCHIAKVDFNVTVYKERIEQQENEIHELRMQQQTIMSQMEPSNER